MNKTHEKLAEAIAEYNSMEVSHGSLFSGIGGFDFAASRVGIETKWCCEIDPYAQRILRKHNANATIYKDIKVLSHPKCVDIISGGFPCQDISSAFGSGAKGIGGERSGLWREYARIIREVRPKYVIAENSPNLLSRGFEVVLSDLSEAGYMCEWRCLSASDFGACHKRERVYIVAYPTGHGFQGILQGLKGYGEVCEQPPATLNVPAMPESFEQLGDYKAVRKDTRLPYRLHRIKGLGNSIYTPIGVAIFHNILKQLT